MNSKFFKQRFHFASSITKGICDQQRHSAYSSKKSHTAITEHSSSSEERAKSKLELRENYTDFRTGWLIEIWAHFFKVDSSKI